MHLSLDKTLPCKGPSIIAVNRKFTHTRLAANRKLCFRFRRLSVIIVGHLVFGLDIPPYRKDAIHTPIIGGSRNRHSGTPQTFARVVLVSGHRIALPVTLRTNLETCPVVCATRHVSTVAVMPSDAWGKWAFTNIFPLIIVWPERTGVFYDESSDVELVLLFNGFILLVGS